MTPEAVLAYGRTAMEMLVLVCAPVLIVALVVGLAVSLFQAVTQINEATLSFLPKLLAVL
ncbi:MAG: EscS/YscS/HrcS family type III secretion system export apparatus protein, partial [Comamonadaceae bacterium]